MAAAIAAPRVNSPEPWPPCFVRQYLLAQTAFWQLLALSDILPLQLLAPLRQLLIDLLLVTFMAVRPSPLKVTLLNTAALCEPCRHVDGHVADHVHRA